MFFTYKDDFFLFPFKSISFFIDFSLSDKKSNCLSKLFFMTLKSQVDLRLISEGRQFVYLPYVRLYVDRQFWKVD